MRFGIIGLGKRISALLESIRKCDSEFTIAGVVDTNHTLPRALMTDEEKSVLRWFDSMDELMRRGKPDALIIGTRCDTHTPLAIEALKYNIPIYLEKPVSNTMEQALTLENAFRDTECQVLVGFALRGTMLCHKAKELLDNGTIGGIEHVLAVNYVPYGHRYFETQYRDYSITQGFFVQKATHDFDCMRYLIGAPIVRVAAMQSKGRVYRDTKTRGVNPDDSAIYLDNIGTPETGMNEDSSSALLEFADGTKGVYTQVFFSKRAARRGATFSGMKGLLEFDWFQSRLKVVQHQEPFDTEVTAEDKEHHWGGDLGLMTNFVAMIRDGAPSLAPMRAGLESIYACLAARESAETGRFVNVRQPEGFDGK